MTPQHAIAAASIAPAGGGIFIVGLLVIAALGFGAVRLRRRRTTRPGRPSRRLRRPGGPAHTPEPELPGGSPAAAPLPSWAPAAREPAGPGQPAALAVVSDRGGHPLPAADRSGLHESAATDWAVEVHGLTKRFGSQVAIDNIDLLVPRGSAFGYLGPNGAGKTTLIRVLLGLTKADSGTMSLLGIPVPGQRSRALARVGAIVDEPRFHGHLTGRQNLLMLAAARGGDAEHQIAPALARTGLTQRADDEVTTYSMGMRQRLGLATCLLADPQLLILDEPMNGLDPAGMHEMRDVLRGLVAEGRTVMLSSHLLDEVERTCDSVAIVDHGRVIRQGPIHDLAAGAGVVRVQCSDPAVAARAVRQSTVAASVADDDDGLTVTLAAGPARSQTAEINRCLVAAGISVYSLCPAAARLEDWFLSVTSRFGSEQ